MFLCSQLLYADHFIVFRVPDFKTEAGGYVPGIQRCGLWLLQLWYGSHRLRKAVKRDPRINMMDMVITDIRCYPSPEGVHNHIAGRSQGSIFIGPPFFFFKYYTRKIMLGIKQISAEHKS